MATLEELAGFLNTKAEKCSFCGHPNLQLAMSAPPTADEYNIMIWNELSKGMPVYLVICMNCGHAHPFSKIFIDKALSDAKK